MRLALLLLSLSACGLLPETPAPTPDPPELRSYDLPPGMAERVDSLLSRVLRDDGRAEPGLRGDIVVLASSEVQAGVADIIEAVVADPPEAVGQLNVRMDYWLVRAQTGDGSVGAGLQPVTKALQAIEAEDGPQSFTLFAHESLLSGNDREGELKGARASIQQVTAVSGNGLVHVRTAMEIHGGSQTSTAVTLKPGQLLVLGHIGTLEQRFGDTPDAAPSSLYVIARATVVQAN